MAGSYHTTPNGGSAWFDVDEALEVMGRTLEAITDRDRDALDDCRVEMEAIVLEFQHDRCGRVRGHCECTEGRGDVKAPAMQIRTPEDVYHLIRPQSHGLLQEHLWVVGLNAKAHTKGIRLVHVGGMESIGDMDPRCIFRELLLMGATRGIVVHNHPSGDSTPSPADYKITRRLVQGGRVLGLPVEDHVIVTDDGWTSIAEQGGII